MTFLELQNQLKSLLAESNVSQYWTLAEMKEYLNEGQREFAKQSGITTKHSFLSYDSQDNNAYVLPDDVVEILHVQYDGKPLDRKSITYLQNAYSGTSHYDVVLGGGRNYNCDWRTHCGIPKHWYFENQKIHCYPRRYPTELGVIKPYPVKMFIRGHIEEGENYITLSPNYTFPFSFTGYSKNDIDVFLNGVRLNHDTWDFDHLDRVINLNYTSSSGGEAVIEYFTRKGQNYNFNLGSLSNDDLHSDMTFSVLSIANPVVEVYLNGTLQSFGDDYVYTFVDSVLHLRFVEGITVTGDDNSIQVKVSEVDTTQSSSTVDTHLTVDYLYQPADMTANDDVPDIPIAYHKAILYYGAYLALIREGAQTGDTQKAMNFLQMFNATIDRAKKMMSDPIDIDFAMVQPFFV